MPDSDSQPNAPLLAPDDDWWNNACLNYSRATWDFYIDGYLEAAQKLVAVSRECTRDTIVFPIAFLFRHYLELQLKRLIALAHRLADEPCVLPQHHRVEQLWADMRASLRKAGISDGAPEFERVTELIREWAHLDADGQSFRYPVDSRGGRTLQGLTHVNIRNLGERMAEIVALLDGHASMIYHYLDIKAEMEEDARLAADGW